MSPEEQNLLHAALHLPAESRAELVDELLVSLHQEHDKGWLAAWQEESTHRWEQLETGGVKTVSGDEAIATLRRRLNDGASHS